MGVTVVEKLELVRQPFPDLDAVYFVEPTTENLDLIIQDFSGPKPKYANCHTFFLSGSDPLRSFPNMYGGGVLKGNTCLSPSFMLWLPAIDQHVLDRFSRNPDFVRRVKTFAEINVDYEGFCPPCALPASHPFCGGFFFITFLGIGIS